MQDSIEAAHCDPPKCFNLILSLIVYIQVKVLHQLSNLLIDVANLLFKSDSFINLMCPTRHLLLLMVMCLVQCLIDQYLYHFAQHIFHLHQCLLYIISGILSELGIAIIKQKYLNSIFFPHLVSVLFYGVFFFSTTDRADL